MIEYRGDGIAGGERRSTFARLVNRLSNSIIVVKERFVGELCRCEATNCKSALPTKHIFLVISFGTLHGLLFIIFFRHLLCLFCLPITQSIFNGILIHLFLSASSRLSSSLSLSSSVTSYVNRRIIFLAFLSHTLVSSLICLPSLPQTKRRQ